MSYVFQQGFTVETLSALLDAEITRHKSALSSRRIGREFLRGKIVALENLKFMIDTATVREPERRCVCGEEIPAHSTMTMCSWCTERERQQESVEFPDGVYWESRA